MALANPTINPPLLPSPTKRGFHTRSPSQSPNRSPVRHYARDYDPLLRDLSPTTTLRAFAVQSPDRAPDFLSKSVETASNSERALGAKAAQACTDLRSWARELEQWQWPGTFDVPEPVRKKQRMSGASLLSMRPRSAEDERQEEEEYWGSLPAELVKAYETRVDEIDEDLDGIDVEELKEYVMAAHNLAGIGEASIDNSIGTIGAATDLGRLDDFTALITATILQALPYLSRLARLLHAWRIRLSILNAASSYLRDLKQARTDLDHGWASLAVLPNPASAKFGRETMDEMKGVISNQVQSLGRRLDFFLDELEGREETVPDAWIDDFETLESSYSEWVVRAESKVHENDWRRAKDQEDERQKEKSSESLLRAEGGLIGRALGKMTTGSRGVPGDRETATTPGVMRETGQHVGDDSRKSKIEAADQQPETTTQSQSGSPSKRSRHVPISIDFDEAGQKLTSEANLTALPPHAADFTPRDVSPAAAGGSTSEAVPNVKKRAAFLNRDIESSSQLNKSKPPPIVRPFEHASNAFTRLFKRDSQHSSASSDTPDGEQEKKTVNRRSFGKRNIKDRVVSNKENVRPNAEKLTYGDLTALPPARKSEDTNRGRTLSKEGVRSLAESTYSGKKGYADLANAPVRWSEESRRPRPRTPKKIVPATYQPTTLGSPFREEEPDTQDPKFPENWPLSESATPQDALSPTDETQEEEISRAFGPVLKPGRASEEHARSSTTQPEENNYDELRLHQSAPDTDALEELFVRSIPNSPSSSRPGSTRSAKPLHRNRHSRDSATTKSSIFSLEQLAKRSTEIERYQKRGEQQQDSSLPMDITTVDEETSPTSVTPPQSPGEFEINGSAIFGSSPRANNRGSRISRSSMLSTSPELAKLQIPESGAQVSEATVLQDVAGGESTHEMMRRASIQSIESHPRSELRSVDIPPRSPTTPGWDLPTPIDRIEEAPPQTPVDDTLSSIAGPSSPLSPLERVGSGGFANSPSIPKRTSSLSASPEPEKRSSHRRQSSETPSSPILTDDYDLAAAPVSKARSKRKYKDVPLPSAQTPTSPNGTTNRSTNLGAAGGDNIDRHVSEVLNRVHAPIRFKTRSGAETPQPPSSLPEAGGKAKSYGRLQQPKLERQPTKSMTLAPADTSPKKGSTAAEPEVKLYHLTQAGRTEPIKLFVRLVGENERVMVRVGGGWADLADYLRQYAEHHGSRTVSEAMLEVQTAAAGGANPATGSRRTFSTPAVPAAVEPKSAIPAASGKATTPAHLERAATTMGEYDGNGSVESDRPSWLDDPQPRFTMGDSDGSDFSNTPVTPTLSTHLSSSRPGTANGASRLSLSTSRPQSRQAALDTGSGLGSSPGTAGGASFGMAGPSSAKAKKEDLPEQKARWVEGMLAKAKESAEKSEKFAEMGRVGGTRRVVFRGGEK